VILRALTVHNLLPGVVVQPHLCDDPQCDRPPVTRITPHQWDRFQADGAMPCPCGGTLRRVHQEAHAKPYAAAEFLETLAGQVLDERVPDCRLPGALRELCPHLEEPQALDAFEDLVEGIVLRDGIEAGTMHWSQALPDATGTDRDTQALETARTRIADALRILTGGA
jgi:hypothetical protein